MTNLVQTDPSALPVLTVSGNAYSVFLEETFFSAPIPAGLAGAQEYTFALWWKRRGIVAGNSAEIGIIFGLNNDSGSSTTGVGLFWRVVEDRVEAAGPGQVPVPSLQVAGASPLGEWVHAAFSREADGTGRIFINGVQAGQVSGINAMPSDLAGLAVSVGGSPTGQRFVSCEASNLQIWNTALTQQQVQDLAMTRVAAPFPAGLLGYWPL